MFMFSKATSTITDPISSKTGIVGEGDDMPGRPPVVALRLP